MRTESFAVLVSCICLSCGTAAKESVSVQETNAITRTENLSVLAWPDNKAPGGFMTGLQLVSVPSERCKEIVATAKPNKAPEVKPDFKTPLAAAEYFGSHLNMASPPKYMAVYTDAKGTKYYLFSGGRHWGRKPIFSEVAVLLETGEIRFHNKDTDKTSETIGAETAPQSQR